MFTLGNRGSVLSSDLEAPVIVPHAAAKNETRVGLGVAWKTHQGADVVEWFGTVLRMERFGVLSAENPELSDFPSF